MSSSDSESPSSNPPIRFLAHVFLIFPLVFLPTLWEHRSLAEAVKAAAAGQVELSLAIVNEMIEQNPKLPAPYSTRSIFLARDEPARALADIETYARLSGLPAFNTACLRYRTLEQGGHYEEALQGVTTLMKDAPDAAWRHALRVDRANHLLNLGRAAEAESELDQALTEIGDLKEEIRLNSRLEVHFNRSRVHRLARELEPALADIEVVIAHSPGLARAYLQRGLIRMLIGDNTGAESDFKRFKELHSGPATSMDEIQRRAWADFRGEEGPPYETRTIETHTEHSIIDFVNYLAAMCVAVWCYIFLIYPGLQRLKIPSVGTQSSGLNIVEGIWDALGHLAVTVAILASLFVAIVVTHEKLFLAFRTASESHLYLPLALWGMALLVTPYRWHALALVALPYGLGMFILDGQSFEAMTCVAATLALANVVLARPALVWRWEWMGARQEWKSGPRRWGSGLALAGLVLQFLFLLFIAAGYLANFAAGEDSVFSYVLHLASVPRDLIPLLVVYLVGGLMAFQGLAAHLQLDLNAAKGGMAHYEGPEWTIPPGTFPGHFFPAALLFTAFDFWLMVGAIFQAPILPGLTAGQTLVLSTILKVAAVITVILIAIPRPKLSRILQENGLEFQLLLRGGGRPIGSSGRVLFLLALGASTLAGLHWGMQASGSHPVPMKVAASALIASICVGSTALIPAYRPKMLAPKLRASLSASS